jgi:hypothetical protein
MRPNSRKKEVVLFRSRLKPGDLVVYSKQKHTTHPGRRARQVDASSKGEYYTYVVDKFWVVGRVLENGRLLLQTRRGKTHVVDNGNPNLRRATLWDRIRYNARFSQLQRLASDSGA